MMRAKGWSRIPSELRQRSQWCFTNPNSPADRIKAPRTHGNRLASVTSPSEWLSFEQACMYAQQVGGDIGYVLTEDDGFTCIDLDVKDATNEKDSSKWTTQADFDRFWRICLKFDSYTELSRSGKGLHIWTRGNIGRGGKRDGVEVYSQERFIICTGNIIIEKPLVESQETLNDMMADIRRAQDKADRVQLEEVEEELTDQELFDMALHASNGDKFDALCKMSSCVGDGPNKVHGDYLQYGYKSQSEADLALMSIFAFYTKSNAQCRRLFRASGLGKRDKASKDDRYLNETLTRIRTRQAKELGAELSQIEQSAQLVADLNKQKQAEQAALLHVPGGPEPTPTTPPASAAVAAIAPLRAPLGDEFTLDWPPGLAGQIAYFVYQSAPRPVKEVAIVTALGFLAGVCGKAFCIPQSGLNLYIILVAKSAIGKEAMHSGMAALINAAASRQPPAMSFVDFAEFASGPALKKACAANPSFVNVSGEWGRRLKRLASDEGRDTPMQQLRTVMTDLYQKSGPQSIVGGIAYSNRDTNISSVSGVSYSMIGESTPQTFYEALTQGMMEDGFLSRFTIIEYTGLRPPLNVAPMREPPKALGDAVADLCTHALTLLSRHESQLVNRTEAAAIKMSAFELECDAEINATEDEMWRQMWNRASLKMMRISALLAVADNWTHPVIDVPHVEWALRVVRRDIEIMGTRIESGDVGNGDDTRERKCMQIIREYLDFAIPDGYQIPDMLRQNGIIPQKYLQIKLSRHNLFATHRGGATAAINATMKSLCDSGYLAEVDKAKLVEYKFHGKAFRILQLSPFDRRKRKNAR